MKTAKDLFDLICSLQKEEQYDVQFGILYICINRLSSKAPDLKFSLGLDDYAADISFVAQCREGEFCSFDVYPHERNKAEAYHVSWSAAQTFQELVGMCPESKNIQLITGSLRRMLREEEEDLV